MSKARAWLPAALWAATIFVLSSLPPLLPAGTGTKLVPTDKLAHVAAYGLLGVLAHWALRRGHNAPLLRACLLAMLLASAYGALDEWHQSFVPNRLMSWGDWLADVIGALGAALVCYVYESFRCRQTHR